MSVHPRVTSPTWTLVSGLYLQQVSIDPTNQFQVAIQYNDSSPRTVVYSRDFGATWSTSTGITGNPASISSNGQDVLVGTTGGAYNLYFSNDYGTSFNAIASYGAPQSFWTFVGLGQQSSYYMVACDHDPNTDTAHIYYSNDEGNSWSTLATYSNTYITSGAWSNTDGMVSMYFVAYSTISPYYSELLITTNTGSSWTTLPDMSAYNIQGVACDQTGQYVVISVSQNGVYRSTNYGASWTQTTAPSFPPSGPNMGPIACDNSGNQIVVMDMSVPVLYASSDAGVSWVLQNTPNSNTATDIFSVYVSPDGSYRAASFLGVGLFSNAITTYQSVNFSNNLYNPLSFVACNNYAGQNMVAVGTTQYGNNKCIVYSTDYGLTWQLSDADASGDSTYTCLAASANGRYVVAGFQNGPNGVVFSNNYGVHFSVVASLSFIPSAIAISNDGTLFYASTYDNSGQVYVGTSTGSSTVALAQNVGVPNTFWNSIACDSTGQSVYGTVQYGGTNAYALYKSTFALPYIYLPLSGSVSDIMMNSTVNSTGSLNFVSGTVTTNAIDLVNSSFGGSTASSYVTGTWTGSAAFTMSLWFNAQTLGQQQVIVSAYSGQFQIILSSDNHLYLYIPLGGGNTIIISPSTISSNTWYSVMVTVQVNGMCSMYLNGELEGTYLNTSSSFSSTSTIFSLGCEDDSNTQAFNGYINDFKIYNSVGPYGLWTQVPQFTASPLVPLSVACDSTGQVVTASAGFEGVYQSVNGGETWALSNTLTTGQTMITPGLSGLSSNSWTNQTIQWNSSASSFASPDYEPWVAFNTLSNVPAVNGPSYSWASDGDYDTVTGAYNNVHSTSVLGSVGTVFGEWLQLQSSIPLVMQNYSFACGGYGNLPQTYYIVGSNDGTNWYPIQHAVMTANACNTNFTSFSTYIGVNYTGSQIVSGQINTTVTTTSYPTSSVPYSYFRLIATSTYGINGNFELEEWFINFTGVPAPFIELPFTNSIQDVNNNSVMTANGSIAYLSSPAPVNALYLNNTAGGSASNYVTGTCAIGNNFTVSLGFNFQSLPASDGLTSNLFTIGTNSQVLFQVIYLVLGSYTGLRIQYYDSSNTDTGIAYVPSIFTNTWYQLRVVFQASGTCSVYLNDALIDTASGNGLVTTPTMFALGCLTQNNNNAFNGYINDLRIYTTSPTTPFIELPFDAAVVDVMGNSTLSVNGNVSYVEGISQSYAVNLVNTPAGTAGNYITGVWSGADNFTISLWVNYQSYTPSNIQEIFSAYGGSLVLLITNDNRLDWVIPTGGAATDGVITPFTLNLNTWYYVVCTFQTNGPCSMYVNGNLIGSYTNVDGTAGSTASTFALGGLNNSWPGYAFNGYISDFRIYNTALSGPTVRNLTNMVCDSTGTKLAVKDASSNTVFRSADSGATWNYEIIDNVTSYTLQALSMDPTGTYVFASYQTLGAFMSQRSSGLTSSWTVTNGEYYPVMTFSNNNVHQAAINALYSYNYNGVSVTAYSTDSGSTWTNGSELGGWVNSMAADSTGQYVLALVEFSSSGYPSVYRSTDYGATFTAISGSPDYWNDSTNCIACDSTGQRMYVGAYNNYVYVSNNTGATWSSHQLSNSIVGIACSYSGQYVFANVDSSYVCISSDYGQTWSSNITISNYGNSQIVCDWSGQYVVAACYNDGIYRSTDYGQTWTKLSAPSYPLLGNSNYYYNIACNSTGNRIIVLDGNNSNIYVSTDAGATWVLQYTPGSQVSEAFIGVSISPDGTHYSAGFYAPGTFFLTSGSPDIPNSIPCFLEGSQILCQVNGVDTYVNVETIRPGMLVKTSRDGYKPVKLIGSRAMTNPGTADRNKNSLYLCTKAAYPELTADLTLTGCHAILVDKITDAHRAGIISTLNRVFVTDKKYRLPACVDERTSVVQTTGAFTVWHFALDHYDIRMNYGVYAQGLLVESSPIIHMNTKNYNLVQ